MKIFSTLTFCLLLTAAFAHADLMDGLVLYTCRSMKDQGP